MMKMTLFYKYTIEVTALQLVTLFHTVQLLFVIICEVHEGQSVSLEWLPAKHEYGIVCSTQDVKP